MRQNASKGRAKPGKSGVYPGFADPPSDESASPRFRCSLKTGLISVAGLIDTKRLTASRMLTAFSLTTHSVSRRQDGPTIFLASPRPRFQPLSRSSAYIFFKRRFSSSSPPSNASSLTHPYRHTGCAICKMALNSCRARGTAQVPGCRPLPA